jgi:hypothetical protein
MTAQFCPQCGAELETNARFCTECGAPQTEQQRPVVPQKASPPNKFSMPIILLVVGALLLIGGAVVYFLGQPDAATEVNNVSAPAVESDIPYPEVERLSVEESKARFDAGTAVIVDVRSLEDYETLHAANAISLPLTELPDRYGELPQDAEIITYCT